MSQLELDSISRSDIGRLLLWAVRIGVLAVVFVPLVVTSSTYFPYVVGKAIYARVVIEITVALWLILIVYYPGYRPSKSWILLAFAAWLVISLVAGLTGVSFTRSVWSTYERMQGLYDLAHWFGFVLVAASVFRSLQDWRILFTVNLAVSAVLSALGLGQHFETFSFDFLGSSTRIESTLGNATYVGAYTMVNSIVGAGLILQSLGIHAVPPATAGRSRAAARQRRRRPAQQNAEFNYMPWLRLLWGVAILINLWALWLTGTRGALIGLGGGMVVFGVAYLIWGRIPIARWAAWAVLGSSLAAAVFVALLMTTSAFDPLKQSSTTLSRLSSISLDDSSAHGRLVAVQAGLRAVLDRPLLGWGPENFLVAWGRYFDIDSGVKERFDQAHSKVFEELTTKGALGLISYLLIWAALALVLVRSIRRREGFDQLFMVVVLAVAVGYFVQNLFLFDTTTTLMQFALLVALLISEERWLLDQRTGGSVAVSRPWSHAIGTIARRVLSYVSNALHSALGLLILVIFVSVLTGSLLLFTVRPLTAAQSVVQGVVPGTPLSRSVEALVRATDEFPGLANYSRIVLFSQYANAIRGMSEQEFAQAVEVVSAQGPAGLEAEPQNWRLRVLLAQFYQAASERQPTLLAVARDYIDEAIALAPRTREVTTVSERQIRLEAR